MFSEGIRKEMSEFNIGSGMRREFLPASHEKTETWSSMNEFRSEPGIGHDCMRLRG